MKMIVSQKVSGGDIKVDRRKNQPAARRSELFLTIELCFLFLLTVVFLLGDISIHHKVNIHTWLVAACFIISVILSIYGRMTTRYKEVTICLLLVVFNVVIPVIAALDQNYLYLGLVIIGFLSALVGFESQKAVLYPVLTFIEYLLLFAAAVFAGMFPTIPFELIMVLFVVLISALVTSLIYNYYIQILAQKMQENNYLAEVNRELLNQSNKDALTGLMNRRHYNKVIKRVVAAFDYLKTPFSLIMLDIDHFKAINDTYGHDCGDIALKELSTVLLKSVRTDDVVCRMGGEEFAIVLQTDIVTAAKRAELIRTAVEDLDVKAVGKFTVSCGVASYRTGMSEEDIYTKADAMLYEAKNTGRNKVCVDWSA